MTVVLLMVILNLCLNMYLSFDRLRVNGEASMETNRQVAEIESVIRRDIRGAARTLERFEGFAGSESLLILESASTNEISVLGTTEASPTFFISRYVQENGDWSNAYLRTYALSGGTFSFETADPTSIRSTIHVENKGYRHTLPGANTFVTALRGGESR